MSPRRPVTDQGATTVELVFVLPVVMMIVLLLAQITVWAHATHVAQATAARALAATRADGGSITAGQAQAHATLDQLASVTDPQITIDRTATQATVRIHGTAATVIPGLHLGVHAAAAGPVERRT